MFQYPLFPEVNPKETTQLIKKIIKHLKIEDTEMRINEPGTVKEQNWAVKFNASDLNEKTSGKLLTLTKKYNR